MNGTWLGNCKRLNGSRPGKPNALGAAIEAQYQETPNFPMPIWQEIMDQIIIIIVHEV